MSPLLILLLILAEVYAENEESDDIQSDYEPYPWRPVSGPYGDRMKPTKLKDPKPDDSKFYYGAYSKPYYPSSYIQGVYTYPYVGYGDVPPWYPPPYAPVSYGGYYAKKENKNEYSPVYNH